MLSIPVRPLVKQPVGVGLNRMYRHSRVVFEQRHDGVDVESEEFQHLCVGGVAIRQTHPEQTLSIRNPDSANPDLFGEVDLFGGEGTLLPLILVEERQL